MTKIEILSTHPDIMKLGLRATEPSMLELINNAKDEIQILSYAVTNGASEIFLALEKALLKGVKLNFVLNDLGELNEKVLTSLKSFKENFQYCKIYIFDSNGIQDLHAKIMVADREKAIVGSSNLTAKGLIWNLEIGFLIEDKSIWKLSEVIDRIVEMSTPF